MKVASAIARILLGLLFVIFGSNAFLKFMNPGPLPGGLPGQFLGALMGSHYMHFVAGVMVVSGLLLLINRFVPLALVLLGPILVNILLYHVTMAPASIGLGLIATILWFIIFFRHRAAFSGVFQAKAA